MSEASFLLTQRQRALIWQPTASTGSFVLQSLDAPETHVELLRYSDITPTTWRSVPALADSFHLVWTDADNRLRSALIHTSGDTLRGPVDLSTGTSTQPGVVPAENGATRVFWLSDSQRQIISLALDAEGRPGRASTLSPHDVGYFSVAADSHKNTHMIWLSPRDATTWDVYYQMIEANFDGNAPAAPAHTIATLSLDPTESITTCALGLDFGTVYAIIGTSGAADPGVEHVSMISFPHNQPEQSTQFPLLLPASDPAATGKEIDLFENRPVPSLTLSPDEPIASLRWPRPIAGQYDQLALTLTTLVQGVWQPAIVYFSDGAPVDYRILAGSSADAGPPTAARDTRGNLYLTWAGLDGARAQRFVVSSVPAEDRTLEPSLDDLVARSLAGIAIGSILSIAWIIAPALILTLAPSNSWTPPLLYTLYSMAKLVWPSLLFAHVPPVLTLDGFNDVDARIAVAVTVLLIAFCGLVSAYAVRKASGRFPWQHYLVFAAVDSGLTWLVFGPNIIT